MHYTDSGMGAPLVLLHAFPLDARMFGDARALLDEQVRLITPDLRGLGESPLADAGTSPPDPGMDVLGADVLAMLDRLGVNEVFLGGCSMGGYVAMEVLRQAPERVAGLVLIDTKAEPDTSEQRDNRHRVADRAEREGVRGWLAENTLPNILGRTTLLGHSAVVDAAREMIDSQRPEGVAWAQRAMAARPDSTPALRGFSGPALVLVGEEDVTVPPASARGLAELMPDAELVTVPQVGHVLPAEAPGAFADAVLGWLSAVS